jgi:ATP-dependent DNA helicase RecG
LFVYADRVEIISPGCLPNNLTVESIRRGTANIRNPLLASYATSFESKLLPYRGLGTGIRRALKEYPDIEFEDDREGNSFRVTLHRQ